MSLFDENNNLNHGEEEGSKESGGLSSSESAESSFDRFYYASIFQAINDHGISPETNIEVPDDSINAYVIDTMSSIVVMMEADEMEEEDVDSVMEEWFDLIKSKALPKRVSNVFLLFVYQYGIPENLRKKLSGSNKKVDFFSRGVTAGYADLNNYQLKIPTELTNLPGDQSLKKAMKAYQNGESPTNLKSLEQAIEKLALVHEKFSGLLSKTTPWATRIITAACVLMFIWITIAGGSENLMLLLRFGANFGPLVKAGEWWRLVGSMFLHIGFLHLFINMFVLVDVGSRIEQYFGNLKFIALYTIAGVTGAIASAKVGMHVAAGASGAIFGLCGAAAWIGFRYKKEIPDVLRNRLAGGMAFFIIYNLLYGFSRQNIDNAAHIGGLVAGVLFAILVPPTIKEEDNWSKTQPAKAFFAAIAGVLILAQMFVVYKTISYKGISSFPTGEYRCSWSNTNFKYPLLFKTKEQGSVTTFSGPGIIMAFEDTALKGEFNIEDVIPEIRKKDEAEGISITSDEIVEVNGIKWLFIRGNLPKQDVPAESYTTIKGSQLVRLIMITAKDSQKEAGEMVREIIKTMKFE